MSITKIINLGLLLCLLLVASSSMKVKIIPNMEQNQRLLTEKELQAFSNVKLMIDGTGEYIYPEANNVFTMYT